MRPHKSVAWVPTVGLATLLSCLLPLAAAMATGTAYVPQTGFVTLQLDDTHISHYTDIFPTLQAHGLKASFGYVTESSDLGIDSLGGPEKIQEIYLAGHEVQDHTTRHDFLWATHVDTLRNGVYDWIPYCFGSTSIWDSLCARSLCILDSLGIRVTGWNQPGGGDWPGCVPGLLEWSWAGLVNDSLYQLIAGRYSYMVGFGVYPNTAHLNLRGHNCPDRYPIFNVPHVTIDELSLDEVKTGIADAIASGLWYPAVSHVLGLEGIQKMQALIQWLDNQDIEVLTCGDGVRRVQYGQADPFKNQLPQAEMLSDIDLNGIPDGFAGSCAWDTLTAPPVEGVRCLRVFGDATFFCYGPEVGINNFSVWMKSAAAQPSPLCIIYDRYDFEWHDLNSTWTCVLPSATWTKFNSSMYPNFSISVTDEVDRLRFVVRASPSNPVLIAYPRLMHPPTAGVAPETGAPEESAGLVAFPNPLRLGGDLRVSLMRPTEEVRLYDVAGRCLAKLRPLAGQTEVSVPLPKCGPGVIFVEASSRPGHSAKVVVLN
jgi:peptidoglycan/xylan/chitin deacetylase (PgdA/CDA1 family)